MHLCAYVREEGGDGEGSDSEETSLLSYTLRYVSLVELGHVCQFSCHTHLDTSVSRS